MIKRKVVSQSRGIVQIMNYFALTQKGMGRSINEDSFVALNNSTGYLFAVADGLGGLKHGDVASNFAASELKKMFQEGLTSLESCFKSINEALLLENQKKQWSMATTLSVALVDAKTVLCDIASVGDSRVYIINDTIWRTQDHTLVQELIDLGVITQDEAFGHPEKHRLTQALGIKNHMDIAQSRKTPQQSTLLLCSDGVSDFVQDRDIATIVRQCKPRIACERLMQTALRNGSSDDITIIIADFTNKQK